MINKEETRYLVGLWLTVVSISLLLGYLASKMERLQWFPLGEMYNFYYILIIGLSVLSCITISKIFKTWLAKVVSGLIFTTILLAVLAGVFIPECANRWSGGLSNRPPCEFNITLAFIIVLIGGCATGITIGSALMSEQSNKKK